MKGAVKMILGVRDPSAWADEAHAQGLALLELALVLRLVLRIRAELLRSWERCALGLPQAPAVVDAIGAATVGHPDPALAVGHDTKGAGISSGAESRAPGGTAVSTTGTRSAARAEGPRPPDELGWSRRNVVRCSKRGRNQRSCFPMAGTAAQYSEFSGR